MKESENFDSSALLFKLIQADLSMRKKQLPEKCL